MNSGKIAWDTTQTAWDIISTTNRLSFTPEITSTPLSSQITPLGLVVAAHDLSLSAAIQESGQGTGFGPALRAFDPGRPVGRSGRHVQTW